LTSKAGCAPRRRSSRARPTASTRWTLTGEMSGYVWSINNVVWNKDVPPLPLAKGERVELIFVNRTPMPHPMHLHGHEFQVV
jgi:FtsP/CotA-like multicopper oxidase with cupredoxin domain